MTQRRGIPVTTERPSFRNASKLLAVLLLVLAMILLVLPASAHDRQFPQDGIEGDSILVDVSSPLDFDESREAALKHDSEIYAAEFEVSAQEAMIRLSAQGEIASIIQLLRSRLGDDLGDAWIEHKPYRLVIRVKESAPSSSEILGIVAESRALAGREVVVDRTATKSRSELEAEHRDVVQALMASGRVFGSGVDARSGRIYVAVDATDPADRMVPLPSVVRDHASVTFITDGSEITQSDHTYGGARTNATSGNGYCTTGFTVLKGSTRGVVTAGHCENPRNYQQPDGLIFNLYYQSQHKSTYGDVQWHTSSHYVYPKFYAYSTALRVVDDVFEFSGIFGGQWLCRYGRKTGQQCDTVQGWPYATSNGLNLVGMDHREADGGDSGGPWFDVDVAAGIHSGGLTLWPFGTFDVWSRASFLPSALGVTVWEQ